MSRIGSKKAWLVACAVMASSVFTASPGMSVESAPPTFSTSANDTPKGPVASVPYLSGGTRPLAGFGVADPTIVDGATRVKVQATGIFDLLGKDGSRYLLLIDGKLVRVSTTGAMKTVARHSDGDAVASTNGRYVALSTQPTRKTYRSTVRLVDARTGRVLAHRVIRGDLHLLAASRSRVIIGREVPNPRRLNATFAWHTNPSRLDKINNHLAYAIDITGKRIATIRGEDPSSGGCSVVSSLKKTRKTLWKGCGETIDSFGPDGLMVTRRIEDVDNDSAYDPVLRDRSGTPLAYIDAVHGVFNEFGRAQFFSDSNLVSRWESTGSVLIAVLGGGYPNQTTFGLSRCTLNGCTPASDTWTQPFA